VKHKRRNELGSNITRVVILGFYRMSLINMEAAITVLFTFKFADF
jgi:hypothetical protein